MPIDGVTGGSARTRHYRHEVAGGYLWSPKRNANPAEPRSTETMREVAPNASEFDAAARTGAVSPDASDRLQASSRMRLTPRATSNCWCPFCAEVSPWRTNGNGIQSVNLTLVPDAMAEVFAGTFGAEVQRRSQRPPLPRRCRCRMTWTCGKADRSDRCGRHAHPRNREAGGDTRTSRGQVLFKQRVMLIEQRCRIMLVERTVHLWRATANPGATVSPRSAWTARMACSALTPSIDYLFDREFIGFKDNGRLIVSPCARKLSLQRMGIETQQVVNVGGSRPRARRFASIRTWE